MHNVMISGSNGKGKNEEAEKLNIERAETAVFPMMLPADKFCNGEIPMAPYSHYLYITEEHISNSIMFIIK